MRDVAIPRLTLRIARREPLYALATVLLLALGIGSLGAMLALYRGTLAQPPPMANWDRLVVLRGSTAQSPRLPLSFPDFEDLRRDVAALGDLGLTRLATVTLEAGDGSPQRIAASRVTPNLAHVLGVRIAGGPGFDVAIGQAADQVVVSDRLWRGALAGQPLHALKLRIGGRAVDVVGVLPPGLRFPTPDVDLWVPLAPTGNETRRDYAFTTPWGLLRGDSPLAEAQEQLDTRVAALARSFPATHSGLRIEAFPVGKDLFAPHRPLIAVFALVGALVFVAVAGNVGALSAARELSRRGETATRFVLGADRARLLFDALRTASVLTFVALAFGALLAASIVRAAEAADAEAFTALRATLDAFVVAGTASGALLLLAAQLVPSWWLQRHLALGTPGAGGTRATTADRGTVRGAGAIVALQIAMCFATVGTLVLSSLALAALERIDLGFATKHRHAAALGVPEVDHPTTIAGFEAAIAEVARLPAVESAAVVSRLPLLRGASSVALVPSSVGMPGEAGLPVDARLVVGPVDRALGLRVVSGRFIDANDRRGAPPVVVVDRRFVATWLADRDPIGARIRLQVDPSIEWQVVGVIDAVRWRAFEDGEAPTLLVAAAQFENVAPMRGAHLVWHGRFDASTGLDPLRESLLRGMPLLSADTPRPLDAVVAEASGQARMARRLLRLLAGIALLLALLGVGALLLYRHERQRRAVGIRLCLGASRRRVVAAALGDSVALAIGGGCAGAALLLALRVVPEAGRLLPADGVAWALGEATAVVAVLAFVGGIVPAWRIARLEPREVLHDAG